MVSLFLFLLFTALPNYITAYAPLFR